MNEQNKIARKKIDQMKELVDQLNRYSYAYYSLDRPIVSDGEYDKLYDYLRKLEEETGMILNDSPTRRIGDVILSEFKKHKHKAKLWSLDKAQSIEELKSWEKRLMKTIAEFNTVNSTTLPPLSYVVTLKFDGLTVNLTYNQGRLEHAATRGTGEVGEEMVNQVLTIKSIPSTIKSTVFMEVRGEGLMPKQVFEEYNRTAEVPLKNPRNAAAGALRNLNAQETAKRQLIAYFYDIGYWEGQSLKTYEAVLSFLEEQGLPVHSYHKMCTSIADVIEEIEKIAAFRDDLDFDIDGAVICVNDLKTREVMGYTIKFPRWAIAYKFEAKDATSTLQDVEWNVGRTGKVTPTALLEPVDIGGVTIKRATLNNMDDIERKGIKMGCRVFVRRSNDVIPEITGAVEESLAEAEDLTMPQHCPACGANLIQNGVHLFCENSLSCKPQMVKSIVHFASRDAMNIEGFNERTAEQLFEELDIREISDLYRLKKEDLLRLDKFKEKKADNLIKSIENSKDCSLGAFIFALGIPNVGKKTAGDLARTYKSLQEVIEASHEELIDIPDIGNIVADSIVNFFQDEKIQESIAKLLQAGVKPQYQGEYEAESSFRDKTVVITGSLRKHTRWEIEKLLTDLGASVSSSVSKKTDYVICGENPGSKLAKAQTLTEANPDINLKIVKEEELENLLPNI